MRKLIVLVSSALSLVVLLAASGGTASGASVNGPRRDGDHGRWYVRACGDPSAAVGACGAQVVTNSAGTPLVTNDSPPPGAYGPAQFHTAYNLPTTAPSTQTIGDRRRVRRSEHRGRPRRRYDSPVRACRRARRRTAASARSTRPAARRYPATNSGWSLEIALDVETAHEICQNCKILLVEASDSVARQPRRGRERGRRARRQRDLELVGRGRVLERDDRRDALLQASGRRDHGVVRRRRLRRRVSGGVAVRDGGRRDDAQPERATTPTAVGDGLDRRRLRLLRVRAEAGLADGHRGCSRGPSPTSRPTPTRTPARRSTTRSPTPARRAGSRSAARASPRR